MRGAFYPSTCCGPIGHRTFLGAAAATAATFAVDLRAAAAALPDDAKTILLAAGPQLHARPGTTAKEEK